MKKIKIAFLVLCVSISGLIKATDEPIKGLSVMLDLQAGVPMGQFGKATSAVGGGFNFGVGYTPPQLLVPITFGADFGYMLYGRNSQTQTLTAEITANGAVIDRLYIPLRFEIENEFYDGHVFVRLEAPIKYVRPFAQVMGGFNYLTTSTKIYDESSQGYLAKGGDKLILDKNQVSAFTYSFGYGGGLLIDLTEQVKLNLAGYYLYGGEADFYDASDTKDWKIEFKGTGQYSSGTTKPEDFNVSAAPKHSRTDLLYIHLGIAFKF